jgi:hypothetical protein
MYKHSFVIVNGDLQNVTAICDHNCKNVTNPVFLIKYVSFWKITGRNWQISISILVIFSNYTDSKIELLLISFRIFILSLVKA